MSHRNNNKSKWAPQSNRNSQNSELKLDHSSHIHGPRGSLIWGDGEILGTPQNINPTFSIVGLAPGASAIFSDTQGQTAGSVEITPAPTIAHKTQITSDGQ